MPTKPVTRTLNTVTDAFKLNSDPNWHSAAQDLVNGLYVLEKSEEKIRLLESVCVRLGDALYPAFLQILFTLEQHADNKATDIVASTLVNCIRSGRLPSGRVSAWGSASVTGDTAFGQTRVLGPIEYACAWFAQGGTTQPLSLQQFTYIMSSLLRLVHSNDNAKTFYCQKLQGDIDDPISGALSNSTRQGLQALIDTWQRKTGDDKNHTDVINAFINELQSESLFDQISKGQLDRLL